MNKDLLIALLGIGLVFAVAGLLVALAKLQEEKERRWDETSLTLTAEKRLEQAHLWWRNCEDSNIYLREKSLRLWLENIDLQDRLSAAVCPRNDHIWVNGVCKKCGRVKE